MPVARLTRIRDSLIALGLLSAICGPAIANSPGPPSFEALKDWALGPPIDTPRMDMARPVHPWGPPPYDFGGYVWEYRAKVRMVGDTRVEIRGTCASACTMFLGARNVCVNRRAMLWFHAAHEKGTRKISASGNQILLEHWPQPVRDWAMLVGALEQVDFTLRRVLTGTELILMGVPECK